MDPSEPRESTEDSQTDATGEQPSPDNVRTPGEPGESADDRRERRTFLAQIDRHSVAIISLLVALISLGYNTWRNETTELQRNQRWAAFTILQELGELQQIADHRHYFYSRQDPDSGRSNAGAQWVEGWGKVTLIRDLTSLLPEPLPSEGNRLHAAWSEHAGDLELGPGSDAGARAEDEITARIESARQAVKHLVESMD